MEFERNVTTGDIFDVQFKVKLKYTLFSFSFFFLIRTSNFGAEAERSYIFSQFEAENVLKMFLNYIVYTT